MRSLTLPILVSTAALLAACSSMPWSSSGTASTAATASCEVATVPSGAVFGVRPGMDIATWPATAPRDGTGCQRVWYGERARPEAMQVLATYYYDGGHVNRLVGRVPNGVEYECVYRDGTLDTARSRNGAQCPRASEARP